MPTPKRIDIKSDNPALTITNITKSVIEGGQKSSISFKGTSKNDNEVYSIFFR